MFLTTPIPDIARCCPRAATGHAAAPPVSVKNSPPSRQHTRIRMWHVAVQTRQLEDFRGQSDEICLRIANVAWVKSRHGDVTTGCPLYPEKQSSRARREMSAQCHNRKSLPPLVA
jgi:hypothetical protein